MGWIVTLVTLLAIPVARAVPATSGVVGSSGCSESSWVGGTTEWCGGALVYRDYVYDDDGADTRPGSPHGSQLSRATGDVDHVAHGQRLNSADIVALRLSANGNQLHVRFELNTLFVGDETVGILAIDTDNADETGSEQIGDFGVTAPGVDQVFVFDQRNPTPPDGYLGGVIEGDVPMPDAPAGEWDIYAFTALGDHTVMNVAFRPNETGNWWEDAQSAALAAGTIAPFKGEVTRSDLLAPHADDPADLGRGLYERVYRSKFAIGPDQEGVDYDEKYVGRNGAGQFSQSFQYLGHFQPYAIYVPAGGDGRDDAFGLQLALHGRSAAHASLITGPGMQRRFGDELHRIIVVPLGRGPFGYYSDWSERDVLDVLDDVEASYPIDRERVFSGGYSMGGYGAYRLAELYPDRFAGAISWVGYSGDCLNGTPVRDRCATGAIGNVTTYLDNLRHVPTANLYATADELVHVHTGNAIRERFAKLGYRHVFWLHAAEHLTLAVLDDWSKEALWTEDLALVRDPAHVTYRTNTWMDSGALGIVHDRAYWVSGIRAAEPGDTLVDLTSHTCENTTEHATTLTNGAGIDPVPWMSQEAIESELVTITSGPSITGVLHNVRSLTLDVDSPCFAADVSTIQSNVPVTIRFSDGRQPVTVTPVGE